MKLTQGIRLCGSGVFGLTPAGDHYYYMLDGDGELTLIDCGLVGNPQVILPQMEKDGLDIGRLKCLFLTRAHPDHVDNGTWLREHLGVQVAANAFEMRVVEQGLLETLSVHPEPGLCEQSGSMGRSRVDRIIEDDEEIQMGELRVRALLISGHTTGSTSYEVEIGNRRHVFVGNEVLYQGFVSVLTALFSDYEHYYGGLRRPKGRGMDGLFPSHLIWMLQDRQKHIDRTLWDFEVLQQPNLKSFS